MRVPVRLLAAVALATAALGTASPANAACAGTANTFVFCVAVNSAGLPSVDPYGSSYNDCIYVGPGPCRPVRVPIPTVTPGTGTIVGLSCGGAIGQNLFHCEDPI